MRGDIESNVVSFKIKLKDMFNDILMELINELHSLGAQKKNLISPSFVPIAY